MTTWSFTRRCPFADVAFDAAISWGMLFHLPRRDQATVFASVSRVLKPGAPFLFNGAEIEDADDAGITGTMNGVNFPYYAVASYRTLIVWVTGAGSKPINLAPQPILGAKA